MKQRYMYPILVLSLCLGLSMSTTACSNGVQLIPACADLGQIKNDDATPADATTLVILIDLPDNQPSTIQRVADDVEAAIARNLEGVTEISLYGGVYGGTEVTSISCMDGSRRSFTYVKQKNNETKVARDRLEYLEGVNEQIRVALNSVSGTNLPTGDFRTLLNWGRGHLSSATSGKSKVVLWSNMIANGSDCLRLNAPANNHRSLAEELASRCESAGLVPSMDPADVEIIGAGYTGSPSLSSFSVQMASAFCARISNKCHVL